MTDFSGRKKICVIQSEWYGALKSEAQKNEQNQLVNHYYWAAYSASSLGKKEKVSSLPYFTKQSIS